MDLGRLGLFGGTFDPPHNGHVAALEAAWRSGRYDQVLVTVANNPYQKSPSRTVADAATRLAMAHAAFDNLGYANVSDREIVRGGATYTVDTVRELIGERWRVEILVGADAAATLPNWHEADTLASLASVGVFPRAGTIVTLASIWRWTLLDMEPVDLSSTYVRSQADRGVDISDLLPSGVVSLYRHDPR